MKKQTLAGDRGLIKAIIIIVVALLILSYFGISLRNLANSPTNQDNVSYIATTTVNIWDGYLKVPATYVWNIFTVYIWDPAFQGLVDLKNHTPTPNFSSTTPALPPPQ